VGAMTYPRSTRSAAQSVLRTVALVLAGLAVAGAVAIVLLPLPRPAAGGTCGPGRGSETAIEAFFDPATIGAGAEPAPSQTDPAEAARFYQWQAFVGECQSATNSRVVDALVLLVVAAFFSLVVPRAVRTAWAEATGSASVPGAAPPGWYPDPADPARWRWWGGGPWSQTGAPGAESAESASPGAGPAPSGPAPAPGAPGPPDAGAAPGVT
jgi:hypothetical protein